MGSRVVLQVGSSLTSLFSSSDRAADRLGQAGVSMDHDVCR